MARYAATNFADISTLDVDSYESVAKISFPQRSVWMNAISPGMEYVIPRGANSAVVSIITGPTPTGTALTDGEDLSKTASSHATKTVTWSDYQVFFGGLSDAVRMGAPCDVLAALVKEGLNQLPAQFDYLAAKIGQAGTYSHRGGATARTLLTDIVAGDTCTAALVRKAHATLSANSAPTFNIAGQNVYCAFVHPHVQHDLIVESSGLFAGPQYVNAPNYLANFLGIAGGFAFFSTAVAPMLEANAGNGGTVDIYNTVFVAADSLAVGKGGYDSVNPAIGVEVAFDDARSMIVRAVQNTSNAALGVDVAVLARLGFTIVRETGVYRIECASSLGTNT